MKNPLLHRIEKAYRKGMFSVRTMTVAKHYGIKTVGKLRQYCLDNPRLGWYFGCRKTDRILNEVEEYIEQFK